jgi:HlyD family secretion protein
VLEVVDLQKLEIEAAVSAADSVSVRVGQIASVQIEGSAQALAARVVRINPSAQAGSRSVLVYLGLDRPEGLRQGLFAQGTLGTARVNALAVPLGAVRTDKPQPYVQLVEQDKVVHRPVETGARGESGNDTWVAVRGIADQAVVILGSVGPLREGTTVKFTASPAAAAPASSPATAR